MRPELVELQEAQLVKPLDADVPSKTMKVNDFLGPGYFEVEAGTNAVSRNRWSSDKKDFRGISGQGAFSRVGLIERKKAFFSLYVEDNRLILLADGEAFNLSDGTVRVARRSPFPFIREFRVSTPTGLIRKWRYWPVDFVEDEPYINDFFWEICRIAHGKREQQIFLRFWGAAIQGTDPTSPEFQQEISKEFQ